MAYLVAFRTYQRALVLSLEKIDNNAVIPLHIPFPTRACKLHEFRVAAAIPVWFLENSIKVFV